MSAFAELAKDGVCGDETVALLRRLGAQVTRTSSFPPPAGYDRWSNGAVDELLAQIFEAKGPQLVLGCYAKATDDASLERLLLAAIRNFLIDQAKGTDRGKLRRRLQTLLGADPRFSRATIAGTPAWTLAGGPAGPWQGDVADLQQAAFEVRGVRIKRWNEAGPTPRETSHALLTVAEAVLLAAGGAVRDEDLARVLQYRFALLTPPTFVPLVADEAWAEPAAPEEDRPDALVSTDAHAEEIWQTLSPTERAVLPHLGKPDRELALVTQTGPKAARAVAEGLTAKLRLATVDDSAHEDVVLFLLQRCLTRP